jgi:hypothetical protein
VTTNVAIRNQRFRYSSQDQRLDADSAAASSGREMGFDYWHVRLLWKAGLQYEQPGWSAGMTLTTPSLGVYGSGSLAANRTVAGDLEALFPASDPVIGAVDQEDLGASVRSSWAMGAGGQVAVGQETDLHASAEWFAAVDGAEVMGIDGFRVQLPGDSTGFHVVHGLKSVINVGAGVQHHLGDRRAIYLAVTTDFSAALPPSRDFVRTEFTRWDLYHLTVGAAFRIRDSDMTIGLRYSTGSDSVESDLVLPPDGFLSDPEAVPGISGSARYNRIKLMLGLNVNLLAGGG